MLKFFSRLERTRNFVLLLFAILMVVSLIVFYAPTRGDLAGNLSRSEEAVATVGGEQVTVGELALQKENAQSPQPNKLLLDQAINDRLMRGEAKRLGLSASDAEVADYIRKLFTPTDGTAFNRQRYEQIASDRAGSVGKFEEAVRSSLSAQKLEAFITSGVTVSEQEILTDYQRKNTKFDLSYVPVSSQDLAQTITPSDEELKTYFEQNKQTYYITSPQKKIRYVFLNNAKVGEKLQFSDEELLAEFDKIPAANKQLGVEGQQIVLRIPKPELKAQISQKANEIYTQATKEDSITAEAFSTLR